METASDLWIQRSYTDGFNSRSKQTAPTSDDDDLQNHSFDGSLYLSFQLLHCISCVNSSFDLYAIYRSMFPINFQLLTLISPTVSCITALSWLVCLQVLCAMDI